MAVVELRVSDQLFPYAAYKAPPRKPHCMAATVPFFPLCFLLTVHLLAAVLSPQPHTPVFPISDEGFLLIYTSQEQASTGLLHEEAWEQTTDCHCLPADRGFSRAK